MLGVAAAAADFMALQLYFAMVDDVKATFYLRYILSQTGDGDRARLAIRR